jgi:hypothetical protein
MGIRRILRSFAEEHRFSGVGETHGATASGAGSTSAASSPPATP